MAPRQAPTIGSPKLARRVSTSVIASVDRTIDLRRDVDVATMGSACGANAVIASIGNGAGVTVSNLPCVTAPGKKLITNRRILEQIFMHFGAMNLGKRL